MNMNNKLKKEISFEQIVAGAILKFGVIDSLDLKLILNDLEKKGFKNINPLYGAPNLGRYIKIIDNNKYTLNDEFPLNSVVRNENCTVKEKINQVVGKDLLDYYANLDLEAIEREKDLFLAEKGNELLNDGNVLLISDDEKDYEELRNYGFNNIDYFRSIVRANSYFLKNPEELNKYHIIITGKTKVKTPFSDDYNIERMFRNLAYHNQVLYVTLDKFKFSRQLDVNFTEISAFLHENITNRGYHAHSNTYKDIFDQIVSCALMNDILDFNPTCQEYKPFVDYINQNKLALPSKKSDIKILYLDTWSKEISQKLTDKIGLKINFELDNEYGLPNYIQNHLGDYDIIIASSAYSKNLLDLNLESTEQCKDTGRQLTLLVTYKSNQIPCYDEFGSYDVLGYGDAILIDYVFGGSLAPDNEKHEKFFKVIRPNNNGNYAQRVFASRNSALEAIAVEAVNIYNYALKKIGKEPIMDLHFKTSESYNQEYNVITSLRPSESIVKPKYRARFKSKQ